MKPQRLTLTGIKSFENRQTIEFAPLMSSGLFAITGNTGSGKSTILDAIIAAMYGGANKKNIENGDLINTKCTDAEIDFEFRITREGREILYRVVRTFKLDKHKVCTGDALLYEDGACVAERAKGVTERIEQIIGLRKNEFCQCVVLEQGEYARFLNAEPRERKAIVGNLFSLQRYGEQLSKKVKVRLEAINAEIKGNEDEIAKLTQDSAGLSELVQELEDLGGRAHALSIEECAADENFRRLYSQKDRYDEYAKKLLDIRARRAEHIAATDAHETAARIRDSFMADYASRREELRAGHRASTERVAILRAAREDENEQAELKKAIFAKKEIFDGQSADSDYAKKQCLSAEAELVRINGEYAAICQEAGAFFNITGTHSEIAEGASGARAQLFARIERYKTAAEGVKECCRQAEELTKETAELREELEWKLACQKQYQEKAENRERLLTERRLALRACMESNALHVIASGVQQGDDCPVCGNTVQHINKTEHTGLELIQNEIDTAEQEYKEYRNNADAYAHECARISAKITDNNSKASAQSVLITEYITTIAETGLSDDYKEVKERADRLCGGLVRTDKELSALAIRISGLNAEYLRRQSLAEQTRTDGKELSDRYRKIGERLTAKTGDKNIEQELIAETERIKGFIESESLLETQHTLITADYAKAQNRLSAAGSAFDALSAVTPVAEVNAEQLDAAKLFLEKIRREQKELAARAAEAAAARAVKTGAAARLSRMSAGHKQLLKKGDDLTALSKLVQANSLMEFVAEEYIEQFALDASDIFAVLTGGEFQLVYAEADKVFAKDKGNKVYAIINTFRDGSYRKTATLSGGETFLVSLALSLAISNALVKRAGSSPIEFMFIDEGFGTLDSEVISQVMDAFERIKNESFTIGLISHRAELTQRIESIIHVMRTENGSAVIVP